MRPSRTALSIAAVAAATGTAVFALAGGSAAGTAAPAPRASVTAPVAAAPTVVAHAVSAPKKTVAIKPTTTTVRKAAMKPVAKPVVKTVAKPVATTTTVAKPAAPKPAAPKPTTTTTTTSSTKTGNDYPYASATTNDPDDWGFTKRQCVSFAAFRLARGGHAINNTQGWGSAYHWDETARALGVRVSSTPRVGAIAHWNVGEQSKVWMNGGQGTFAAGSYGHVGYVAAVYSDGSALIEQYNAMGDRSYSTMRMTAPRYLF